MPTLTKDLDMVWMVWDSAVNTPPTSVPIPTDGIKQAIFGSATDITRRVDILEADGVTMWQADVPFVDGSVNVSMSASERRTFDLTLYNDGGALDSYPGGFWYDKIVKVYRGAVTAAETWSGLLGTFMIDKVDSNSTDNTVSISGRDMTKKLRNAKFRSAVYFPPNEPIENIISAIAFNGGITDQSLPLTGKNTIVGWTFGQGTERWKAIKDIATAFDYDLYFDETGKLVMTEFADILNDPVAFVFQTGASGNLASYRKSSSDARLRNHVVVIGENNGQVPVFGEAENTLSTSPTSIAAIGRRTETYKTSYVGTQPGAVALAERFLSISALEQFEVPLDALVIPWLDVNNVITFTDPSPAPGDPTRFLLTDIRFPLTLDPMSATLRRVRDVGSVPSVMKTAVASFVPNGGAPYDESGQYTVERGSIQDSARVVPWQDSGLAVQCPSASVTTTRPFVLSPTLDTPTSDIVDLRVIFNANDATTGTQVMLSKWDTASNQRCWRLTDASGFLALDWSPDGTATGLGNGVFNGLTLADGVSYAIRLILDVAGGTLEWEQHDVANAISGDWSQTPLFTESDTHTTLTLNADNTVPIAVGADFVADPEVAGANEFGGMVRFAQVRDDRNGAIMATFDPTRDTVLDSTSWYDADTTDTWALASAAGAQTDWPTYVSPALSFDGGDFLQTDYTPSFTATTGKFTVVAVYTPKSDHTKWRRIFSAESANGNGFYLAENTTADQIVAGVGGGTATVTKGVAGVPNGTRTLCALVQDNGSMYLYTRAGGLTVATDTTGVGAITWAAFRIGAQSYGLGNASLDDMEDLLLFEGALTAAQLDDIATYYGV